MNELIEGLEEEVEMTAKELLAAKRRKSTRIKMTNSRMKDFILCFLHSNTLATTLTPSVGAELDIPMDTNPDVVALFKAYKGIFATPIGLPPSRAQNHAIPLLLGT
ncbi:hypothetical protein V8G54_010800 [Vigna mungo]|uniref:Uncharacterized protein n=1 Tax=Vigna mungo TaxID=3915 RepID=A0AAQ3NY58_VIGMU